MKNRNALVLTSITLMAVLISGSMPAVFAQSTPTTHSGDPIPAKGECGDLFSMQTRQTIFGGVPDDTAIVHVRAAVMLDIAPFNTLPSDAADALLFTPTGEDIFWELQDIATGNPATSAHLDVGNQQSQIFFDDHRTAGNGFGSGSPTNDGVFFPFDSLTVSTNGVIDDAATEWVVLDTLGNPKVPEINDFTTISSTGASAKYIWIVWSFVDENDNGVYEPEEPNEELSALVSRDFEITCPVGGDYLLIDSSAFMVAGSQTSSLWVLSILGLAGTIIAIKKLEA